MGLMLVQCCLSPLPSPPPLVILLGYPNSYGCYPFKKTWVLWELHSLPKNRQQCFNKRLNLNMESGSYLQLVYVSLQSYCKPPCKSQAQRGYTSQRWSFGGDNLGMLQLWLPQCLLVGIYSCQGWFSCGVTVQVSWSVKLLLYMCI